MLTAAQVSDVILSGEVAFVGNNASGSFGGALSLDGWSTLACSGEVRFEGSWALQYGGAVYMQKASDNCSCCYCCRYVRTIILLMSA